MKVWIDQNLCTGDARCVAICPDVFFLQEEEHLRRAYVRDLRRVRDAPGSARSSAGHAYVGNTLAEAVVRAAKVCPGECIFVEGARCSGPRHRAFVGVPQVEVLEPALHADQLELALDGRAGHWLVTATGEIDSATSPRLRQCLADLGGHVVVDLSRVSFLDASGIGALVGARTRLVATGGNLVLRDVQKWVERILTIAGAPHLLDR